MTREGAPTGAPCATSPTQAIYCEHSRLEDIAQRDALAEAEARARALAADLRALATGRWPSEPVLLAALADLADAAAAWARTAARRAAA
jgi:hypothetical protein